MAQQPALQTATAPAALGGGRGASAELASSAGLVGGLGTDLAATLAWVAEVAPLLPLPGTGATEDLWYALADAATLDVAAARMLEPHLDALAIFDQARTSGADSDAARLAVGSDAASTWGVFAAEARGMRLMAQRGADGTWILSGTKPWCSLAGHLTHALVTAWVGADERRLFAVDLRVAGVRAHPGPWVSRGLSQIVSAPVDFDAVEAAAVGEPGWYQHRPGFAWGGMGVAAVWWGAARPLADALRVAAGRDRADQFARIAAGAADAALWGAEASLQRAAALVDAGVTGGDAKTLAERLRANVADAVERVLSLADRALGPGPLTADEEHSRRVADLRVYLRQHHADRDLARLGGLVAAS